MDDPFSVEYLARADTRPALLDWKFHWLPFLLEQYWCDLIGEFRPASACGVSYHGAMLFSFSTVPYVLPSRCIHGPWPQSVARLGSELGHSSRNAETTLVMVTPVEDRSAFGKRGQDANVCFPLVARLSQTEYLLLGSLADRGERIAAEEAGWQLSDQGNYLLPRQDSHAWLQLSGRHAAEVMAKVCGVDLRAEAFPVGAVAQTSAARINVIVTNAATGELPRFQILFDRASLEYFHGAMLDAMDEFGGQPVGLEALLA